jgi:hypothetical protein
MKQEHLTENELQQYALQQHEADHQLAAHIMSCAKCSAIIANYQVMFSALSTMEKPVLHFDIEQQIMAALSVSPKRKRSISWPTIGLIIILITLVAIPGLIFRHYFSNIFSISAPVLYLVVTTALTIVIFQCRELLTSYRQKMRLLNYH